MIWNKRQQFTGNLQKFENPVDKQLENRVMQAGVLKRPFD
jgi:hypothetical protein